MFLKPKAHFLRNPGLFSSHIFLYNGTLKINKKLKNYNIYFFKEITVNSRKHFFHRLKRLNTKKLIFDSIKIHKNLRKNAVFSAMCKKIFILFFFDV